MHYLQATIPNPFQKVTSCEGCGCCCLEQESPPGYLQIQMRLERDGPDAHFPINHFDPEDVARFKSLPPEVLSHYLEYVQLLKDGKPHPNKQICIWYDEATRKCRHYDLRPSICRDAVEVGDQSCLQWRANYYHIPGRSPLLQIEPQKR